MSKSLKRLLYLAGSLLAILSVIFVVAQLIEYRSSLDLARLTPPVLVGVMVLAIGYVGLNLALAVAWRSLLFHQQAQVTWLLGIWVYGTAQLAKYVPGNLFHLAGRQAIGMAVGLSGKALAKSTLWELGLISVTAVLFMLLTLPLVTLEFIGTSSAIVFFALAVIVTAWLMRRWFSVYIAQALLWYVVFLCGSGIIFAMTLLLIMSAELTLPQVLGVVGAYVMAWLAGLVTPGAPAGIGIREVVLYAFLNSLISQSDLLLVIVMGRVITVSGDLLYFVVCLAISVFYRHKMVG